LNSGDPSPEEHVLFGQSGEAQNKAETHLATKLANDVNGVKEVKNQMSVIK
jgi:osmotically-inducible protein OsmY